MLSVARRPVLVHLYKKVIDRLAALFGFPEFGLPFFPLSLPPLIAILKQTFQELLLNWSVERLEERFAREDAETTA